jgi:hypothetical protein
MYGGKIGMERETVEWMTTNFHLATKVFDVSYTKSLQDLDPYFNLPSLNLSYASI